MRNKIDKERAVELCMAHEATYVSHEIKIDSAKNKKESYISFKCNKHSEFGIMERKAYDFIRLKKICPYCNGSRRKDVFKRDVERLNPTIELLTDYVNWDTKIKCKCKIDGTAWETVPSVLLSGSGCPKCGLQKSWDTRGRKTTEVKNEMKLVNPNIIILGEYTKCKDRIKCQCAIDGCQWESVASNLLNGTAGCPECNARMIRERDGLGHETFLERMHKINPDIEIIGTYENLSTPVKCKCLIHNYQFESTPRNLIHKHSTGCPFCTQSTGEKRMLNILRENGLNIIPQYSFDDCVYKSKLKFDAYDPDNNVLYEYQGEQHYKPVDFAGRGDEWANEQFEINQIRDSIKEEYCKKNNITLVKIPYWDFTSIEKYIQKSA